MSRAERLAMVECVNPVLPVFQQCRLPAVSRSDSSNQPSRSTRSEPKSKPVGYTLRRGFGCRMFGIRLSRPVGASTSIIERPICAHEIVT
jgi:hypothetical protein